MQNMYAVEVVNVTGYMRLEFLSNFYGNATIEECKQISQKCQKQYEDELNREFTKEMKGIEIEDDLLGCFIYHGFVNEYYFIIRKICMDLGIRNIETLWRKMNYYDGDQTTFDNFLELNTEGKNLELSSDVHTMFVRMLIYLKSEFRDVKEFTNTTTLKYSCVKQLQLHKMYQTILKNDKLQEVANLVKNKFLKSLQRLTDNDFIDLKNKYSTISVHKWQPFETSRFFLKVLEQLHPSLATDKKESDRLYNFVTENYITFALKCKYYCVVKSL